MDMKLTKRPKMNLPNSSFENLVEIIAAFGLVFTIYTIFTSWPALPERIPTHFGFSGNPDAWGGKSSMMMFPVLAFLLYTGLSIFQRFPHIYNYPVKLTEENVERQYRIARNMMICIKAEIVWTFAVIEWQIVQVALGKAVGLGPNFLILIIVVIFATSGIGIYQAYRER
jgi:uncharacterized membrane protein